ncbi:uncharacterized protein LOC119909492 [Micropterus salmoides]|uniref:uncharacterized protein LOC119909492 n=1 Tax=Micropterus salmoides TaxID=27706 RepID=UPI0018EA34AA|nr:uncharacterized protein LOC119909492 [Micropterus salmoides]
MDMGLHRLLNLKIGENTKAKSDRLSVTENCSLVIKTVTDEDVGRYTCRQFISGQQQGPDSVVLLSVINSKDTTTTTENSIKAGITTTASAIIDDSTEQPSNWWLYIIVTVILVALIIIVVNVIRWKRAKENKTGMNDNVGLTSDPALTESAPENSQDTADPEDGVSYAAVSFTTMNKSKGRVQSKNYADEGDAVTYTTMKASSADPSNLYATIN